MTKKFFLWFFVNDKIDVLFCLLNCFVLGGSCLQYISATCGNTGLVQNLGSCNANVSVGESFSFCTAAISPTPPPTNPSQPPGTNPDTLSQCSQATNIDQCIGGQVTKQTKKKRNVVFLFSKRKRVFLRLDSRLFPSPG
jgi:hypothetical protein